MAHNSIGWRLLFIFLFIGIILPDIVFAQHRSYTIMLKDKDSGLPLVGATIISLNSKFSKTSDSTGIAIISSTIIDKNERLQVTMVGYIKLIINAKNLAVHQQIELKQDIVTLEEIVVTNNSPVTKVRNIQMGAEMITALEAKALPAILGEIDIIKLLQLKPGVKNAGEGLAGFYVRGGGADQNLILIDNAPVYNPNHLLGLFSVFNNDAVHNVVLYKAAYPAQYSGRLSSVLDVSMKPGSLDSFSVGGGIGLLSSRLSIESPIKKGKSSFIISGRRTYFDVLTGTLNKAYKNDSAYEPIPGYFFSDINLRTDWEINKNNSLWATGYWGSDNFKTSDDDFSARFNWGNRTASLNWKSTIQRTMEITSSLFYSNYNYTLSNQYGFNNFELRSGINTIGLKIIAVSKTPGILKWQAGIDGMLHTLNIGDFQASSDLSGFNVGEKISGNEGGVFLNTEWNKSKKLALLAGIRLSGFHSERQWDFNLEPRMSARYNLGENAAFKGSYTRMYQYLHLASLSSASLPTDIWYPSTTRTRPQYADQVSIGFSHALHHNSLFFSLEGYYKWMNNQVEFRDGANIFGNPKLENDFVYGKGNAYGLETYIEKQKGKTTGWFGYTLSWATRTFADINDGEAFKPRYDRRHDFSFVFIHKFNTKFSLSGNWIFGSGAYITVPVGRYIYQNQIGRQPRTITPVYTKRSNYQLAPVHRLDVSVVMALKSKKGTKDLTFSLYNMYSRRNPFYIQFREVDDEGGYITAIEPRLVSLFPILPGITYNFKF